MANISVFTKSHSRCAFYFQQRGGKFLGIIGWHHRKDRGESLRSRLPSWCAQWTDHIFENKPTDAAD
jgi:hypothetical protein